MKQTKLRIPTLLLAVWMLIAAIPMVCFAEQDAPLDIPEDQFSQAEEQDESNSTVEKDVSLTQTAYKNNTLADMFVKVSYEPIVNNSDSISVSFDTDKIIKYNIDTTGVQIVSSSTKEGIVKLNALDEFGVVSIGLVFEDGSQNQYKLYTYRTNSQTFISDVSCDMAWCVAAEELLQKGKISLNEYQLQYGEMMRKILVSESYQDEITNTRATGTYEVSGTIFFRNTEYNAFSLKRAKIALYSITNNTYTLLKECYTDDEGYYSFSLQKVSLANYTHLCLRIYPESEVTTVRVSPIASTLDVLIEQDIEAKYIETPKFVYNNASSEKIFTYTIGYDENASATAAIFIHQGMVMGEIFAEDMGTSFSNTSLDVFYPLVMANSFAYYRISGIKNGEFANFDTILHEYGHFVAQTKGVYAPSLLELFGQNGLIHYYDTDHFEDIPTTEFARELTWSEAWASAFSMITQDYFKDEYQFYEYDDQLVATQYYADDKYHFWGIDEYNPTIATDGINACEAQEWAVTSVLYHFYDKDTDDAFDSLKWGYNTWFQYTTRPGTYALADLVDYVYNEKKQNYAKMANILQHYWISPQVNVINLSNVTEQVPPSFTYTPHGSVNNPNGCRLAIFDQDWQCIYWEDIPSGARNLERAYSVSPNIWSEICSCYSGRQSIYLTVMGYKQGESTKEPLYPSNVVEIPLDHDVTLNISSSQKYGEIKVGVFPGATESVFVTFSSPGPVVIQTMGNIDVMIEVVNRDTEVVQKTFNQTNNEGQGTNAYFDFYPTVGEQYEIKVKNAYAIASGRTKLVWFYRESDFYLTTTPTNYDNIPVETYDSVYTSMNIRDESFGDDFKAIRFNFEASGEYEIMVTTGSMSALIVLDPTSNKMSYYGENFSEGLAPELTLNLSSSKEYLILYCAARASSEQDQPALNLYIITAD